MSPHNAAPVVIARPARGDSVLATNKVIRNTYLLLSMTLAVFGARRRRCRWRSNCPIRV
ncbi:MAG: hypothetical protein MZV63_40080 [Marinilabiliales bacterium]|nr:hypothetical protein [Marinilabiliales bacterium]